MAVITTDGKEKANMLSSRKDLWRAMTEGWAHRRTCTLSVNPALDLHWGETILLTIEGSTHECAIDDVNETFTPSQGLVKKITVSWELAIV